MKSLYFAAAIATLAGGLIPQAALAQDSCTITKDTVMEAQQGWGEGIEAISRVFVEEGDFTAQATEHINTFYAYEDGMDVLFKPTLASEDQYRETFDEALSYFVGGIVAEDTGFAIKPWSSVRWGNGEGERQISVHGNVALAMGNYYFTPVDSEDEVKVEYTFAYVPDENCDLKIVAHHSSLPYAP